MESDTVKSAPSILAADFARLGEQVAEAEKAGANRIHVDVMDGVALPCSNLAPAKAMNQLATLLSTMLLDAISVISSFQDFTNDLAPSS